MAAILDPVETLAEVSNTSDATLADGTMIFCAQAGSLFGLQKSQTSTANGQSVLNTQSSAAGAKPGRWVTVVAALQGTLTPTANAAAASLIDNSVYTDGTTVFVETFRDYFQLSTTSTAAVDGVTVLATRTGTGRWLRLDIPSPSWLSQTAWGWDPTTGNDENVGSVASPLKTFDEFMRRVGPNFRPTVDYTVTCVAGTFTDYIYPRMVAGGGGRLIVKGTLTQQFSGAVTAEQARSGNTPWATTAGWTVATELKRLAKITAGTASGAYSWVGKDLGGGKAQTPAWYVLTDAVSSLAPGASTPDGTSTVATFTATQIGGIAAEVVGGIVNSQNANLLVENFTVAGPNHSTFVAGTRNIVVQNCRFDVIPYNDSGVYFLNTAFNAPTTIIGAGGPSTLYTYGGIAWNNVQAAKRSQWFAAGDFTVIGGQVQASTGAYVDLSGVGVFDSPSSGINAVAGCDLRLRGSIYGSGNAGAGVAINGGVDADYDNAATITITGAGGDFTLGGNTSAYAWDDANHVYTAAKATLSWANLVATVAGGGFGNQVFDPLSLARLAKNV